MPRGFVESLFHALDVINDPLDESGDRRRKRDAEKASSSSSSSSPEAERERARIVAWLRSYKPASVEVAAHMIERGEHLE